MNHEHNAARTLLDAAQDAALYIEGAVLVLDDLESELLDEPSPEQQWPIIKRLDLVQLALAAVARDLRTFEEIRADEVRAKHAARVAGET